MFNPTILSEENTTRTGLANTFNNLSAALADLKGEIDAVAQYDDHIKLTSSTIAKNTWKHIRDEELHHVGELLALIGYLSLEFKEHIEMGRQEWLEKFSQNNMT